MKKVSLLIAITLLLSLTPASAKSISGAKCTKAGVIKVEGNKRLQCLKIKSTLRWTVIPAKKSASPSVQTVPVEPVKETPTIDTYLKDIQELNSELEKDNKFIEKKVVQKVILKAKY